MIGDRMGELIGKGIKERVRKFVADWWAIPVALAALAVALWIGGSQ